LRVKLFIRLSELNVLYVKQLFAIGARKKNIFNIYIRVRSGQFVSRTVNSCEIILLNNDCQPVVVGENKVAVVVDSIFLNKIEKSKYIYVQTIFFCAVRMFFTNLKNTMCNLRICNKSK